MGWSACTEAAQLMRVLFPLHGYVKWNGGLDLVRLLVSALSHRSVSARVDLNLAMPEPSTTGRMFQFALRHVRGALAGNPDLKSGNTSALMRIAAEIARHQNVVTCSDDANGIADAARISHADVVFPTMLPLGATALHRIGYLFDFQHRYMPQLFSTRTRRNRDRSFARIAADCDGLVVNSRAVARDVTQWLGVPPDRVLGMPFAPYAMPWSFDVTPADAQRLHQITGKYLLISNHFWKHKDHVTAFRAFAALRANPAYADVQLVLTGDPIDHRDPRYYRRLVALTDELHIAASIHFLGLIPKREQLALLRGSAALIQPTLFEGSPGGGSVYEAIGLGVPAVVSDIPMNREIDCGNVVFFRAGDPFDLVQKIAQTLAAPAERPSRKVLLVAGDTNLADLGNTIADFLDRILLAARS